MTRILVEQLLHQGSAIVLLIAFTASMVFLLDLLKPPSSPFEPPFLPYQLFASPIKYLAQVLYNLVVLLRGPAFLIPPPSLRVRLVCISDTHTHKPTSLPPGDVLVHAGDLTNAGTVAEIQDQVDWLSSLPHKHKIVIAGNHDSFCDPRSRRKEDVEKQIDWKDLHYLQHSSLMLTFAEQGQRSLHFYGAPQIPQCGGEDFAFQYRRGDDAWSGTIPTETDVLITHTPPRFHLDLPAALGCEFLLQEVWKVRPRVHIFGHVHAGYGRECVFWDDHQRAYEMLCARRGKGSVRDMVAVDAWIGLVRLAIYGVLGILWSRVWQGDCGGTLMVNSSLMYRSTGNLGNLPQVIDV